MTHGSARMTARLLTAALLSAGFFGFALPAQAGFEFKPAASAPAATAAPDTAMPEGPAASPAASVDMTPLPGGPNVNSYPMGTGAVATPPGSDIASMPGQQNTMLPPTAPGLNYGHAPAVTNDMVPPAANLGGNRPPMTLPPTSPLLPMGEGNAAPQGTQSYYASINGFGKDMPLALAMHEIVPTGYAYSFEGGVDPGLRVNWQGGRPWNEVLAEALAPYGLRPVIGGQTVRILPAHAADMAEAVPSAPPAQALTVTSGPMPRTVAPSGFAASGFAPMPVSPAAPTSTAKQEEPTQSYPHRVPHKHLNNWQPDSTSAAPVSVAAQDPGPPPVEQRVPSGVPASAGMGGIADGQGDLPPPPSMTAAPPVQTLPGAGQDAMTAQPQSPAAPSFYTAPQTQAGQTISAAEVEPMAGGPSSALNPPPAGPASVRFWTAEQGQSLKTVLQQWCQDAGIQLSWNAPSDYKVPQSFNTSASFTDALRDMLSSYDTASDRPKGALHTNTVNGQPVLVIESAQG